MKKNTTHPPFPSLPHLQVRAWLWDVRYGGEYPPFAFAAANVDAYFEFVALAAEATDPDYGYGTVGTEVDPAKIPTPDHLAEGRISHVFWLNVWPEAVVDRLGRERVLSAPAWRVRELATGGVLVVAADNPSSPTDAWVTGRADVAAHLGLEY
ncbi:hypothetical protein ACFQH6_18715 [Halobacteriaceae archaeon GCM10025711]